MDPALLIPIPQLPEVITSYQVDSIEVDEPLVDLAHHSGGLLACLPMYSLSRDTETEPCFARLAVAERLMLARAMLPPELGLVILDAWRPISLQRRIFDNRVTELIEANPSLSSEQAQLAASQYVTNPYAVTPPHSTGGAIDLTLSTAGGIPIWCGTEFDDFSERSATRFFEEAVAAEEHLSAEDRIALTNRRVLFNALTLAGFTNYREEWWHFDYGDAFWSQVVGEPALYGVADDPGVR